MKEFINKQVIVRADRAGVFFGTLAEKEGNEVKLTNCRRLWYWRKFQTAISSSHSRKITGWSGVCSFGENVCQSWRVSQPFPAAQPRNQRR